MLAARRVLSPAALSRQSILPPPKVRAPQAPRAPAHLPRASGPPPSGPIPAPPAAPKTLLQQATATAHRGLHGNPGIPAVMQASTSLYRQVLVDKLAYFSRLEKQLQHFAADAAVKPFLVAELRRRPLLAQDLEALGGNRPPISDAAAMYTEYLGAVAPSTLAVHAYINYLAEMAGGQMLGRSLKGAFPAAISHLHFVNREQLRQRCIDGFEGSVFGPQERDNVLAEVHRLTFYHNRLYSNWYLLQSGEAAAAERREDAAP